MKERRNRQIPKGWHCYFIPAEWNYKFCYVSSGKAFAVQPGFSINVVYYQVKIFCINKKMSITPTFIFLFQKLNLPLFEIKLLCNFNEDVFNNDTNN